MSEQPVITKIAWEFELEGTCPECLKPAKRIKTVYTDTQEKAEEIAGKLKVGHKKCGVNP